MPVSPSRQAAYRILLRVTSGGEYAVNLLQAIESGALGDAGRRLTTEIVMGVLRWQGALDAEIGRWSSRPVARLDPEVAVILRMGAYQILRLDRVPKSAAVNESVELAKMARHSSASGLVNAVLRKIEKPAAGQPRLAARHAGELLPGWLYERWRSSFGAESAGNLALASLENPPAILRPAQPGVSREALQAELAVQGVITQPCRYAPQALRVTQGNPFSSAAWREGRAVAQDEASQLVAGLLMPVCGQRVLDACAAPGIKTSQIALALERGTLVAADVSKRRLQVLRKLIDGKIPGAVDLHILHHDAARQPLPADAPFDRILVDAPCTGTGTLARNPEIKWRLVPDDVARVAQTQRAILSHALAALAPGGRLVYSTCSLEPEENEDVLRQILAAQSGIRLADAAEMRSSFPALASLIDPEGFFRTRPDRDAMDGFFAAVLLRE